jgi:hypothetical protein
MTVLYILYYILAFIQHKWNDSLENSGKTNSTHSWNRNGIAWLASLVRRWSSQQFSVSREHGGVHSPSGRFGEEIKFLPLPAIESRFVGHTARGLVTTPATLCECEVFDTSQFCIRHSNYHIKRCLLKILTSAVTCVTYTTPPQYLHIVLSAVATVLIGKLG